jgi:hypothetical protein
MAEETSFLARASLATKITIVAVLMAAGVGAGLLICEHAVRCPSYIFKDPQTGQCFYVYNDAQGHEVRQPLTSCPAGC